LGGVGGGLGGGGGGGGGGLWGGGGGGEPSTLKILKKRGKDCWKKDNKPNQKTLGLKASAPSSCRGKSRKKSSQQKREGPGDKTSDQHNPPPKPPNKNSSRGDREGNLRSHILKGQGKGGEKAGGKGLSFYLHRGGEKHNTKGGKREGVLRRSMMDQKPARAGLKEPPLKDGEASVKTEKKGFYPVRNRHMENHISGCGGKENKDNCKVERPLTLNRAMAPMDKEKGRSWNGRRSGKHMGDHLVFRGEFR